VAALAARAQTFEVASIKPAEQSMNGMIRIGVTGGPGTNDPGRMVFSGVPLQFLITYAFDVKSFQISGPEWLLSERFDVTAKVPPGATKEESRIMLRNLLAERFRMTFHREKKEMASYVLTVGRNGSKMQAADPPKADAEADAKAPPPPPPGRGGPPKMGKDGFPELPEFAGRGGGPMMIMMPGRAKMTCLSCPVSRLADTLGNQLGKPVVDMTELPGNYAFTLIFEPDMSAMRIAGGMPMPPPGAVPAAGPPGGAMAGDPSAEPAPPLLSAIQDQLGLKLEPKKAPADFIAIDHMEKTPTEN
jgi:uncharacterized protein (TIGR03435 family)